ncbi:matrixin family metalloprotease [Aureimonas sp. AU12]|uniref:matrixin family metalloprotease n=1 Tax=Aureimonas sp. AU12 TaxID=1638161 RepID=UPI00078450F0|nr:matrixin family metalloprotease [Aureimonas sp. AU12]
MAINYNGSKWGNATFGTAAGSVTWSFDSSFDAAVTGANSLPTGLFEGAIQKAFGLWESLARIDFTQLADRSDTDIVMSLGGFDGANGTLGQANWYYYNRSTGQEMVDGQVTFDTAETWDFSQNPASYGYNLFAVAVHEIGHLLGLGHSDDPSSLMYPYLNDQRGPTSTDIASIQEIYGANPRDTTADTEVVGSGSSDVFRFYNTASGTHFYTSSVAERDFVGATLPQYRYEGNSYDTTADDSATSVDVFRFYNTDTGTHFYTASVAERDQVIATLRNYRYEGEAYEASATDGGGTHEALYRFYNSASGVHFYTANQSELASVFGNNPTFQYEGIAYYVDAA